MTPQDSKPTLRALKTWQLTRNITGVLVIISGIATVVAGIVALRNERDTWSAMKLPVFIAIICSFGFVHAQKKILAMSKRNTGQRGSQVKRISPMLPVADLEATLDFYTRILGFNVTMRSPDYSIVERDGATIHFMKAASEAVMQAVRGHAEIYIEVADIVPLWAHVSQFKQDYRIRDLFDRDYGMREFHVSDPNDCLVFVGQRIS